ncbi:LAETG motif-containing sortase-dependent surface protein [Streptomyces sp. NPDC092296]|uniref:LAETG motif-containing sortase-dependent surface protein n=1 Tax=Streptomyces sp. NPDC092296 TaxID=3366012 RepID=UPI0037F218BF
MTRQGRVRSGIAAVAAATALLGTGVLAGSASAHVSDWSVDCSTVSVDLTGYNGKVDNTLTVTAGGETVLGPVTFRESLSRQATLPEHSEELSVELVVKAGDGDQYSRDEHKTAPVCPGHETPTTPPPTTPATTPATTAAETTPPPTTAAPTTAAPTTAVPTTPVPTTPAPTTPAEAPSSSAPAVVPAPSPSGPNLAETGSSSSTPIIAGVAAAVVVVGGVLLVLARRRRGSRG